MQAGSKGHLWGEAEGGGVTGLGPLATASR